ncbi:hypothetical protein [Helicobacter turcicus]|uniref:Type II secretion system protein n=1 Tax=Helicobacter turcicus TaxID=2867412 RepID=A0ABS7JP05_9HELI|nr:hypothetical protein [Helicobacter turcicus]MBX7491141.1 hypothetical protein [Helicobacter turcicus]MBX7546008.1 hypothetical protein [Helicobacter turcicus]
MPKNLKRSAFTLLEVLLAILLLGVFGIFSAKLLLGIYQNYSLKSQSFQKQLKAQNALLQIKRLLENAQLKSLQILSNPSGAQISTTPKNLIGESLIFYEKLEHFSLHGDFAIPCFHGIFNPKSVQVKNNTLTLDFLKLSQPSSANTTCDFKIPKTALLITEEFIAPQDFYNPNFQGKILALNTDSITLELPSTLRLQPLTKISPQLYFLNSPTLLHFSNSIILEQNGNKTLLLENLSHFSLKSHHLGLYAHLCLEKDSYCASTIIVEL